MQSRMDNIFFESPQLYAESDGQVGIDGVLTIHRSDDKMTLEIRLRRTGEIAVNTYGISLGIDTCMSHYPQWNDKYFPTMLRCEPTHLWGYFMNPAGETVGVISDGPIPSYSFDYGRGGKGRGHRIYQVRLQLINRLLPDDDNVILKQLEAGGEVKLRIELFLCGTIWEYGEKLRTYADFPIIAMEKTVVCPGDALDYCVDSKSDVTVSVTDPKGTPCIGKTAEKYGVYTVCAQNAAGYRSIAKIYCRRPWDWYLKRARIAAMDCPPHATTHCESWYGFFSAFAAAKHYPERALDDRFEKLFDEIMPLIFDFENVEPLLIPERIQNTSSLISLLVDRYEVTGNIEHLKNASRFADWLMRRQGEDGAYYRGSQHYTCVIYPAKSMLELSFAERSAANMLPEWKDAAERHYQSAKRAVDDLVRRLEDIGTEGESTLEDGMLSCSALQLAYFALTLPESERKPYIDAAEHMLSVHRCLELNLIPDCRMRQATIRFWEAQYDVLIHENMMTSPHGWSAWLIYAEYYLYLLTGKYAYLLNFMNGLAAAVQLVDEKGKLRWAFMTQPCLETDVFVPDETQPIRDGYRTLELDSTAYRGKTEGRVLREGYIDLISGWYRTGEQRVNGGYDFCPLILKDSKIEVDPQGGCCDNDVHEVFKCLEETVLKKAFIYEHSDGSLEAYGCELDVTDEKTILSSGDFDAVHFNLVNPRSFVLAGNEIRVPRGLKMIAVKEK